MPDYAMRRRMMVDTQVRPSDVTKFPIIDAMLSVPREKFVPDAAREAAYAGEHVPLGDRRVVLDPRILAKMLDSLEFDGDELVLDVGGGLGYSSALMSRMAQAVVLLEEDPDLADEAQTQLSEIGADNVIVQKAELSSGDTEHGPYDVIIVQGGIEELPEVIAGQLKEDGRIACLFVDGAFGTVKIGRKIDGVISWRFAFNGGAPILPGFERQEEFSL